MEYFQKLDKDLEQENETQSFGPGYYQLDQNTEVTDGPVYPWAPTVRIQKIGGSLLKDKNLTDVSSELLNITRPLSNDPETHYKPSEETIVQHSNLKDGFFHQESTLLSNPPSLLRGQTKNRWIDLYKDPLENTIEPFDRLGKDTYLEIMDDDEDCKVEQPSEQNN